MFDSVTAPRAAIIATRVYEPEGTAAAYRLGNLTRGLERHGYSTTVLTTLSPSSGRGTKSVRRWPVLRDSTGSVRGYLQYASFDVPLFFRLLFGPQADVVVVEPPPTTGVVVRLACWIRRTPYVYFSADVTSAAVAGIGVSPVVVRVVRWLEQIALRGASGILAVSEGVEREVVNLGADPELITMVGTGIDTQQFSNEGPLPGVDFRYLIYAGTMSEIQGADVFVDAFMKISANFPDARLKLFGSGVDVERLRAKAAGAADHISFSEPVRAAEIATWIRGACASLASVRPGLGYDFASPTKALASTSCGTPVIYAGSGPLKALIAEHELGWVADWDVDDVAAAMVAALERRPEPDARLASWTRDNFSLLVVANRSAQAISQAIDGRRRKRRRL